MLNPEQITQMRAQAGIPAQGYGSAQMPQAPSAEARIAQLRGNSPSTLGQETADQYMQSGQKIVGSVTNAGKRLVQDSNGTVGGLVKGVGDVGEGLLGSAAGVVQGVFAPVTASIGHLLNHVNEVNQKHALEGNPGVGHVDPNSEGAKQIQAQHQAVADWAKANPRFATNLQDALTVGLAGLGGEAGILGKTATEMSVGEGTQALKGAVTDMAQGTKNVAVGAKNSVTGAVNAGVEKAKSYIPSDFQKTYAEHSLRTKTTNNVLKSSTFSKTDAAGNKITTSPLDTLEQFTARPKVESTANGFKLNTEAWQEEASAKQMAFDKQVTSAAAGNKTPIPVATLRKQAFADAAKDTELTDSPAREASVQKELDKLFKIYIGKGDTIDARTLNRFRIGANKEAKAYYDAQNVANVKGVPPRISPDTAKAYEIMAGVFRDQLIKAIPEVDDLLTQERAIINANRYATQIHLSTVGPGMIGKTSADIFGGAVGATLGSPIPVVGPYIGGAAGAAATEKVQKFLTEQQFTNYKPSGLRKP